MAAIKLDSQGIIQNIYHHETALGDYIRSAIEVDGLYIFAGNIPNSGSPSLKNIKIVVVNPQNMASSSVIDIPLGFDHHLRKLKASSDGGFLACGKIKILTSVHDIFLSKFSH